MISSTAYGLGLGLNAPIAGLVGLRRPERIDVNITLGKLPADLAGIDRARLDPEPYYVSPYRDERGQPSQSVVQLLSGKYYRIDYCDGTVVVVDNGGENIWAVWPEDATIEDAATYLLGPVLGFVLRLRGVTCLHASSVAIGDKAIAIVGPSGAGKSSTAAAFAKLGYPILSDDVVALSDCGDHFMARPAYPRVRLWPQSVASLFGMPDALPRITPTWDKRFLDLKSPDYRFQQDPLPLAAIYYLAERSSAVDQPEIEPQHPREGIICLLSNTYTNFLLNTEQRAQEFDALSRLVESVPIRRITPSAEFSRIEALCAAIVTDFKQHGLTC